MTNETKKAKKALLEVVLTPIRKEIINVSRFCNDHTDMKCSRRTLDGIINGQIEYTDLKKLNEILNALGMKLYVNNTCFLPIDSKEETIEIAIPLDELASKEITHFKLSALAEISEHTEKCIRKKGIRTLYQLISICVAIQATVECK